MKTLFMVMLTLEQVLDLDRRFMERGSDWWANVLCWGNEKLWPEYDGEGWSDLWLRSR